MTKKQKKIAKKLLKQIEKTQSVEERHTAVRNYSIFMSECREQETR